LGLRCNRKKNYDNTNKFQTEWASNLPWAKGLMNERGFIQSVKCIVCSSIKSNNKIVGCKWDRLTKHASCKIVVWDLPRLGVKRGETYIVTNCAHLKNMKLYALRGPKWGPKSILTQVNKSMGESNQKMVPIKTLFRVLTHGHPMLEYETLVWIVC
jgi:hypothetical protein